MNKVSMYNIMW